MLKLFENRYELSSLKFHLENSIDEQYWARDVIAKYVSSKFNGCDDGNLVMIGPQSCEMRKIIEVISNFVHVPLLVIGDGDDAQEELGSSGRKLVDNILTKLLRVASYDIEKASVGIVLFQNVNHYPIVIQKALAKLMCEVDKPVQIKRTETEPLPKEIIGNVFRFEKVMLIGTINCDVESKIARRYMMDLMQRKINRLNAITLDDLVKLKLCQELAVQFNYIAPLHGTFD